jgi:hypothetical protein
MTAPARTLPVSLPPLHRELLGSYLHRLADANHLTIRGLSHEIGPGRHHRRDSDDTAGWTPAAVTRLAALAGTTATALLHAFPVLQAVAPAGQATAPGPSLPPWHAHACLLCAARRGACGLAIIRIFPHERICARHGRWHGGGPRRPLRDLLPEIPHANALHRPLARRHGTAAATGHFLQAQAQTRQWLAGDGPADLKSSWKRRLGLPGEDPHGDPHRPSPGRIELVTYPGTVTMTALTLARPASHRRSSSPKRATLEVPAVWWRRDWSGVASAALHRRRRTAYPLRRHAAAISDLPSSSSAGSRRQSPPDQDRSPARATPAGTCLRSGLGDHLDG